MPAKSQQQRKLIFAKRGQYGSIENTPKKWKWVWESGWENKGKLPTKVRRKKRNEGVIFFSDFLLNEGLITLTGRVDVPEQNIQSKIERLQTWFNNNPDEDFCYIKMFGHSDWRVNKDTLEKDVRDAARLATMNEKLNEGKSYLCSKAADIYELYLDEIGEDFMDHVGNLIGTDVDRWIGFLEEIPEDSQYYHQASDIMSQLVDELP